jgi:hypothetical protein
MTRQGFARTCAALILCVGAGAGAELPRRAPIPAEAGSGQVLPMRYDGTRPAVEVRVNGRGPFLFLIDTGAGGPPARADAELVRRLGLRQAGQADSADAGGAAARIDRVVLDRVELGSLAADHVEALARDYNGSTYLPHIDGILGLNFFSDVLLTLDFAHGQIRLARGALPPADGRTILDYVLVDGNPAITVRIGARPVQVLLDTGDIRALDLPSEWLRSMPLASFPRLAGTSGSISGTVGLREVALAEPLTIGRYRFDRPLVTFADEYREANLGSAFLRAFTVTIDQRNRRVRLVAIPGRSPFR